MLSAIPYIVMGIFIILGIFVARFVYMALNQHEDGKKEDFEKRDN